MTLEQPKGQQRSEDRKAPKDFQQKPSHFGGDTQELNHSNLTRMAPEAHPQEEPPEIQHRK
jgi:hypothetical protein